MSEKQLKQLEEKVKKLKEERDFSNLIKLHDESLQLLDTIERKVEILPQKAYCLARCGRHEDAKKVLQQLGILSSIGVDKDVIFRCVALISGFISSEYIKKNSIFSLHLMHINTIKTYLKDPEITSQVTQIIFDYEDILYEIEKRGFDDLGFPNKKNSDNFINFLFSETIDLPLKLINYSREFHSYSFDKKFEISEETDRLVSLGNTEYRSGNLEEAIIIYHKAINKHPLNDDALQNLYVCYETLGMNDKVMHVKFVWDYVKELKGGIF